MMLEIIIMTLLVLMQKGSLTMARNTRHPNVDGAADSIRRKHTEESRTYCYCSQCSHAIREESIVTADEFKIDNPDKTIRFIVGYQFTCAERPYVSFHDTPDKSYRCITGDADCSGTCKNCKFSEPVVVHILHEVKTGIAAEWCKEPPAGCDVTRTFYVCTNRSTKRQYKKGTVMCPYVTCKRYKPKE